VGTALGDAAVMEDEDLIGGGDGLQSVGDDEQGAVGGERTESIVEERFDLGVDGGGGFVEQHDRRVLEQGAGDRDPLSLAPGDRGTAFSDPGVEAVGEPLEISSPRARRTASSSCSRVTSGRATAVLSDPVKIARRGRRGASRSVPGSDGCEPAVEERALGVCRREFDGTGVCLGCLVNPLQSSQEVSSCRMEEVVAAEVEFIDEH
jgi:hypothetical protein